MWLASSRPDAKAIKGKYGQQISVLQGRQPSSTEELSEDANKNFLHCVGDTSEIIS